MQRLVAPEPVGGGHGGVDLADVGCECGDGEAGCCGWDGV